MLSGADGLSDIFADAQKAVQGLIKAPIIARDIKQFASLAKTVQSPGFQQEIQEAKTGVETFAKAQLALSAISAVAIFGLFLMQVIEQRRKG